MVSSYVWHVVYSYYCRRQLLVAMLSENGCYHLKVRLQASMMCVWYTEPFSEASSFFLFILCELTIAICLLKTNDWAAVPDNIIQFLFSIQPQCSICDHLRWRKRDGVHLCLNQTGNEHLSYSSSKNEAVVDLWKWHFSYFLFIFISTLIILSYVSVVYSAARRVNLCKSFH